MTPAEVAEHLGKHSSNMARALAELASPAKGLLVAADPPPRKDGAPGAPSKAAYDLTDAGRAALVVDSGAEDGAEAEAERRPGPAPAGLATGRTPERVEVVFADARAEALPDLYHVLARAKLERASWVALIGGERREYAIGFTGPSASRHADDLVAELTGAALSARPGSVSDVVSASRFQRLVRERAEAASRGRAARGGT
jgi:hypothetical protein